MNDLHCSWCRIVSYDIACSRQSSAALLDLECVTVDLVHIRQQGNVAWWVRGAAFVVLLIGWFERRDFWPVMAAGVVCTILSFIIDDRDNPRAAANIRRGWIWPFWSVVALSIPSLVAVVITAHLVWGDPTGWGWALPILLYFYIPIGLVLSAIVAGVSQHSMTRERRRKMWEALAVALSAVPLSFMLLWLAAERVESSLRR